MKNIEETAVGGAPTDAEIEADFIASGGRWADESYWQIEDADLHPFARRLLARRCDLANVGGECMSEDECIAKGIRFGDYERGVSDAIEACERRLATAQAETPQGETQQPATKGEGK